MMRGNPDDLANQLVQKVKDYLQEEADIDPNTVGQEDALFSDYYLNGRKELAEGLLSQIEKWEAEEEQGTVYTGDAPSTEASFYKKTFVGISETEYKKSEVEDLDNQSYSEGEEYGNE